MKKFTCSAKLANRVRRKKEKDDIVENEATKLSQTRLNECSVIYLCTSVLTLFPVLTFKLNVLR